MAAVGHVQRRELRRHFGKRRFNHASIRLACVPSWEQDLQQITPDHGVVQIAVDGADPLGTTGSTHDAVGAQAHTRVKTFIQIIQDGRGLPDVDPAITQRRNSPKRMHRQNVRRIRGAGLHRVSHVLLGQRHSNSAGVAASRVAQQGKGSRHALRIQIVIEAVEGGNPALVMAIARCSHREAIVFHQQLGAAVFFGQGHFHQCHDMRHGACVAFPLPGVDRP